MLPLRRLGQGIARITTPESLGATYRDHANAIVTAVARHPQLVAGRRPDRFDTDLIEASAGQLFAKGGADGVQVIGVRDRGLAFVGKVDDGNTRGLYPLALEALRQVGCAESRIIDRLEPWTDPVIRNADNLEVGIQTVVVEDSGR